MGVYENCSKNFYEYLKYLGSCSLNILAMTTTTTTTRHDLILSHLCLSQPCSPALETEGPSLCYKVQLST